jgi:hypothetical protein
MQLFLARDNGIHNFTDAKGGMIADAATIVQRRREGGEGGGGGG